MILEETNIQELEDENALGIRDYKEISKYRKLLIGKKISSVMFKIDADEGLIITCEDGTKLEFGFSGCEGTIWVG